jgi:hypothetical protein
MPFAGEHARGRIEADPAGTGDIHLGPGVQIGKVHRGATGTIQRRLVGRQLDQMIPTAYRQVNAGSYQAHIRNLRGSLSTTIGTHAQGLAAAQDEPQLLEHLQGGKQAIAGNIRAGVIAEADARPLFSQMVRQAVTIAAAAACSAQNPRELPVSMHTPA